MEWNRTLKHFGELPEKHTVTQKFIYLGEKEYEKHEASCGCITSVWKNNELNATFTTSSVPANAKQIGKYFTETSKFITVHFKDGSKDRLEMRAIILAPEWLNS
jgi:hypothetical protein